MKPEHDRLLSQNCACISVILGQHIVPAPGIYRFPAQVLSLSLPDLIRQSRDSPVEPGNDEKEKKHDNDKREEKPGNDK